MAEDNLKQRQDASAKVQERMLHFLCGFDPAGHLSLDDAKTIARYASTTAFDEFSDAAKYKAK